jgi:hypothetical protein
MHAALVTVSGDGCRRIVRRHQGREGGSADALAPRFIGELPLPRLEASRRAAALRGAGLARHPQQRRQDCDGDGLELSALGHLRTPFIRFASDRHASAIFASTRSTSAGSR